MIVVEPWVEITPTCDGTYKELNVTSYVGYKATGIVLLCRNNAISGTQVVFLMGRKGTTGYAGWLFKDSSQAIRFVGLDANKICRYNIAATHNGNIKFYIIAYFEEEAVFLDTAVECKHATLQTWQDKDLSASVPSGAVAVIIDSGYGSWGNRWGVRCNGSSDNYMLGQNGGWMYGGAIIGCDSGRVIETISNDYNTAGNIYCIGYITSGTFKVNSTAQISTAGAWKTIDVSGDASYSASHTAAVVEFTSGDYAFGVRKNGQDENYTALQSYGGFGLCMLSSGKIQYYWNHTDTVDVRLIGFVGGGPAGDKSPFPTFFRP